MPDNEPRIQEVDFDRAKYVINLCRLFRDGDPTLPEYFSVKAGNAPIVTVYRQEPKAD